MSVLVIMLVSCQKEVVFTPDRGETQMLSGIPAGFVTYTIAKGAHSSDKSTLKSIKTGEMKFAVIFDSSAIYQTVDPINQSDINKLYGFSEGWNNSYNSARIGWSWFRNELLLHAYVYAKGVRSFKKITAVAIGAQHNCSIKVSGSSYIFTVNGVSVTMPRGLKTSTASGLQQYPYFGGDEKAPQKITIHIKNL
ncbi:MAG: hypothetical protein MUE99_08915 [Chitinophagaceae bacterium]|nr:hypothetical protein [Chitinophagaceae bacterium]